MDEQWRPAVGFEGYYEVSSLGRIRSLTIHGFKRKIPKVLKPILFPSGYHFVNLHTGGKQKTYKLSRIIAMTFIPNPDNLPMVNHKNEDKGDNRIENLEWCDGKYNSNYGTRNQRLHDKLTNRTDMSRPVEQYDVDGNYITTFPSMAEARRQTGVNRKSLTDCCKYRPKHRTAGGFVWRYA